MKKLLAMMVLTLVVATACGETEEETDETSEEVDTGEETVEENVEEVDEDTDSEEVEEEAENSEDMGTENNNETEEFVLEDFESLGRDSFVLEATAEEMGDGYDHYIPANGKWVEIYGRYEIMSSVAGELECIAITNGTLPIEVSESYGMEMAKPCLTDDSVDLEGAVEGDSLILLVDKYDYLKVETSDFDKIRVIELVENNGKI